ncbi:hypothetical protein HN924_03800 [Candidatus Woesearchaeota archaeon]|jgi:mRNA-degrading endonuclease RelE of RelBE toxin-antitoxin system|nr:hypothetical protein [Candidatus Woesearchaeota archaeon]MBT7402235.1 hypothetical protein [Candidatus Woesearchaeota archaeon]
MKFKIIPTKQFLEQAKSLDVKTKRILNNKIDLLKKNPYRFKKLHGFNLKLFEIKLNIEHAPARLIYTVIEPNVILICFLHRKNDFKDLDKYVKQFERN